MKLHQIKDILNAKVLTGEKYLDREVKGAVGCNLMSDVLAYIDDSVVLLTELTNHQVIRTAEMIDLFAIIFVKGKIPSNDILELANKNDFTLMTTDNIMCKACDKLCKRGLADIKIGECSNESIK